LFECHKLQSKAEKIKGLKKFTFLTGSGISAASNIPTYRGKDGYWKNYNPTELATTTAFNTNPKFVWEWYYERRRKIINSKPNRAHYIIAEIEKYKEVSIITQNVDGLHLAAGSINILELHGNIFKVKCTVCDFKGELDHRFPSIPPICEKCGNYLRPDVVWFDEDPDKSIWSNAKSITSNSDIIIIVGTSLRVDPANELPLLAKKEKKILIEINPEETIESNIMDVSMRTNAIDGLNCLLNLIGQNTI